jgi:hypothetical protein
LACTREEMKPFEVAVYGGKDKPDISRFMHDLVQELLTLVESDDVDMEETLFVCDTPARSYVKCTKGHTGYSSCFHCEEPRSPGSQNVHTIIKGVPRTNESFRNCLHPNHHTGRRLNKCVLTK